MEPRSQAIEDPVLRVEIDRIDRNMRMLTAPAGTVELFLGPWASVPAGYSPLDGGDRSRKETTLGHGHYAHFYTTHFGFEEEYYRGKRVLDIGCGPRGSLEWAAMAEERVGLDPLADSYRELGTDAHAMDYCCAPAEKIPYPDGHFDVVCSFNSLDHVDDRRRDRLRVGQVVRMNGLDDRRLLHPVVVVGNDRVTAFHPNRLDATPGRIVESRHHLPAKEKTIALLLGHHAPGGSEARLLHAGKTSSRGGDAFGHTRGAYPAVRLFCGPEGQA